MFRRCRGPDPPATPYRQLREEQADRAAGADHQDVAGATAGHFFQRLPGGQRRARQCRRAGFIEPSRQRQQGVGVEQGVFGEAAVAAQPLVVGDPAAEGEVAAGAGGDDAPDAVDARDMVLAPGRMAPLDDLPVHRVEGDGTVGHQYFAGAGSGQRLAQQVQAVEAGARGPAPGEVVIAHGGTSVVRVRIFPR